MHSFSAPVNAYQMLNRTWASLTPSPVTVVSDAAQDCPEVLWMVDGASVLAGALPSMEVLGIGRVPLL